MQNEIKKIITSMDVKEDRDDAQSKALTIYKFGLQALDGLVDLGISVNENEIEMTKKKKLLRAVIFSLSLFAQKKAFSKPDIFSSPDAIRLLCELSLNGYHSATSVLSAIGFSDSDILKEILLSLPLTDKHPDDRQISMNEAIEEIKTNNLLTPINNIKNNAFHMGFSKKHSHEIFRIGNKDFVFRLKKCL